MYFLPIDEKEYVLKPMNCPGHILIYKTATRSYRDMPIRYCELGTVYRYERSGSSSRAAQGERVHSVMRTSSAPRATA